MYPRSRWTVRLLPYYGKRTKVSEEYALDINFIRQRLYGGVNPKMPNDRIKSHAKKFHAAVGTSRNTEGYIWNPNGEIFMLLLKRIERHLRKSKQFFIAQQTRWDGRDPSSLFTVHQKKDRRTLEEARDYEKRLISVKL